MFYVKDRSNGLQILQKQNNYQEMQTFFVKGFNYQIFSYFSLHWERFWVLLKHAYSNLRKRLCQKKSSVCGAESASYVSGLKVH